MIHQNNNLLQELEELQKPNPRSFNTAKVILGVYIVAEIFLQFLTWKRSLAFGSNINLMTIAWLALPVIGLILFSLRKKAGWIINVFFYQIMWLVFVLGYLIRLFRDETLPYLSLPMLATYVSLVLLSPSLYLLYSKSIREYLGISRKTMIITIAVCVILMALLSVFAS